MLVSLWKLILGELLHQISQLSTSTNSSSAESPIVNFHNFFILFLVVSIYRNCNCNYNLWLRCGFWGGYRLIIFRVRMRCTQFFAIREKYILQFQKIYFVNWDKYGSGLIIFHVRMRCTQSFAIREKYILQFENNSFLKLRQICPAAESLYFPSERGAPTHSIPPFRQVQGAQPFDGYGYGFQPGGRSHYPAGGLMPLHSLIWFQV